MTDEHKNSLKTNIQMEVATIVGVPTDNVMATLSAGSVKVDCVITPSADMDAAAVKSKVATEKAVIAVAVVETAKDIAD